MAKKQRHTPEQRRRSPSMVGPRSDFFRRFLPLDNGIPSPDTFERVFAKLGFQNLRLAIDGSTWIFYFPAEDVAGQHVAFRVDKDTFGDVVGRLRSTGVAFGNDPEDQTNMETSDFLGGHGRVFFRDPNGHAWAATAARSRSRRPATASPRPCGWSPRPAACHKRSLDAGSRQFK